MAGRRDERSGGNNSLEVFWVRLNGSDTTLETALRTVQQMRNGNGPVMRQVPTKPVPKLGGGKNGESKEPPEEEPTLPFDEHEEVEGEVVETEATETPIPPRAPRKARLPKGIPDLDFNSADPTFRDFVAGKSPKEFFDWYLLVAYWLKKHKGVDEIGLSHIVTAKQYIGADWSGLPEDPGTPFRDGRRATIGIFEKGSKNGLSKITKNGEDRVERMGK